MKSRELESKEAKSLVFSHLHFSSHRFLLLSLPLSLLFALCSLLSQAPQRKFRMVQVI